MEITLFFLILLFGFSFGYPSEFCSTLDGWTYCFDGCCDSKYYYYLGQCCTDNFITGGAVVGISVGCICVGGLFTTLVYYVICYRPQQLAKINALQEKGGYDDTIVDCFLGALHTTKGTPSGDAYIDPPSTSDHDDPLCMEFKGVFPN